MRTLFKILFFGAALMAVMSMVGGFALMHGWHHDPDMSIVVNGEEVFLDGGVGDWVGAGIGLFVAGIVVCIVVPLVLLLGVALPLVIMGGVLSVVVLGLLGVGAVLGSPLILIGLVLFFVLRNRSRNINKTPSA